jgi:hypothetical protein
MAVTRPTITKRKEDDFLSSVLNSISDILVTKKATPTLKQDLRVPPSRKDTEALRQQETRALEQGELAKVEAMPSRLLQVADDREKAAMRDTKEAMATKAADASARAKVLSEEAIARTKVNDRAKALAEEAATRTKVDDMNKAISNVQAQSPMDTARALSEVSRNAAETRGRKFQDDVTGAISNVQAQSPMGTARSLSSAQQKPAAQPAATALTADRMNAIFQTATGAAFDPKSRLDRQRLAELQSVLDSQPDLADKSPTKIALAWYRSKK